MKMRIILVLFLFFYIAECTAQGKYQDVKYKKWSFVTHQSVYRGNVVTPEYGKYHIRGLSMYSFRLGIEHLIYKKRNWELFTGLNYHKLPLLKFDYLPQMPYAEISKVYTDGYIYSKPTGKTSLGILSMPIGITYTFCSKYDDWSYSIKAGFNIDFLQYGQVATTHSTSYFANFYNSIWYLNVNMLSHHINFLYPSLFLNWSASLHTSWSVLSLGLVLQKALIPHVKGTYRFDNLLLSEPSGGKIKTMSDYAGATLGVRLKKFKKV